MSPAAALDRNDEDWVDAAVNGAAAVAFAPPPPAPAFPALISPTDLLIAALPADLSSFVVSEGINFVDEIVEVEATALGFRGA